MHKCSQKENVTRAVFITLLERNLLAVDRVRQKMLEEHTPNRAERAILYFLKNRSIQVSDL
jgi:hypothetical protein